MEGHRFDGFGDLLAGDLDFSCVAEVVALAPIRSIEADASVAAFTATCGTVQTNDCTCKPQCFRDDVPDYSDRLA